MSYIGNRIRELRTNYGKTGLSQEQLAQKLGVAANTISRWETATYKPSVEDLEKLSLFFAVPILDFFPAAAQKDQEIDNLVTLVRDLSSEDREELRRYAEFRRARKLYE
jgi:transcriptional regulator with XRE-family HTH domain